MTTTKYLRVKFGDLKIKDLFRYNNKTFHKTLLVDMGSCIYNAITNELFGESFIVCLPDDKIVNKIVK